MAWGGHHTAGAITLTGYGTDQDHAATTEAGFDAHLTKPVSMDQLIDLIEGLLGRSEADQDSRPT